MLLKSDIDCKKTVLFLNVAPCSLVEFYSGIRDACCLHHQGDDDGSTDNLWNASKLLPDCMSDRPINFISLYNR